MSSPTTEDLCLVEQGGRCGLPTPQLCARQWRQTIRRNPPWVDKALLLSATCSPQVSHETGLAVIKLQAFSSSFATHIPAPA
jgi:hypothetical protein